MNIVAGLLIYLVVKFCSHRTRLTGGAWGSRAAACGGAWRRVRPSFKVIFGLLAYVFVNEHAGLTF
jgi:hypothetical protein